MSIEVIGVPGSGKSTNARQVAGAQAKRLVDLSSRQGLHADPIGGNRRRIDWLTSALLSPRLSASIFQLASPSRFVLREAFEVLRRNRQARKLDGSAVIDEGPWHPTLWLAALSGRPVDVALFVRRLHRPDCFLRIRVEHQTALDRIITAGDRESVTVFGIEALAKAMSRYELLVDELARWIPTKES